MKKIEKKVYTVEEVDELKKWFDNQTLPQSMQINSSAYSPDLKDTVAMLFEQAYICCNNPKMQGCLLLLENIKKNLEEKNGISSAKHSSYLFNTLIVFNADSMKKNLLLYGVFFGCPLIIFLFRQCQKQRND